jgi:hypothetical protein
MNAKDSNNANAEIKRYSFPSAVDDVHEESDLRERFNSQISHGFNHMFRELSVGYRFSSHNSVKQFTGEPDIIFYDRSVP